MTSKSGMNILRLQSAAQSHMLSIFQDWKHDAPFHSDSSLKSNDAICCHKIMIGFIESTGLFNRMSIHRSFHSYDI